MRKSDIDMLGSLASSVLSEAVVVKPAHPHKGDLYKRARDLESKIIELRNKMNEDIEGILEHSKFESHSSEPQKWLESYENMINVLYDFIVQFALPDVTIHDKTEEVPDEMEPEASGLTGDTSKDYDMNGM